MLDDAYAFVVFDIGTVRISTGFGGQLDGRQLHVRFLGKDEAVANLRLVIAQIERQMATPDKEDS